MIMKRFIKNTILFILVVSIVTFSINFVFIKLDKSDNDNLEKFEDVPLEIEYCNFGSSHGLYGYNYVDYEEEATCFNFALSSQYLSYDERMFELYKSHISDDAVVFINVSYFSLFGPPESEGDSFASKNKRYYKIFPHELIKDYDLKTDIYVNYLPSLTVGGPVLASTLLGKSQNINEETWSKRADDPDLDVVKDGEAACLRHIIKSKLDENGNRYVNQEEYDSLVMLINGCREIGANPVLITTPFLREYTDQIKTDKTFYDDFYGVVNDIVSTTHIQYYDFGFDERFVDHYDLFMNSDHLNEEGARVFVDILMEEVVPEVRK